MKKYLQLNSAASKQRPQEFFTDFKIGNINLAMHLGLNDDISSLDVDPKYARQLLLEEPPDFTGQRVPLYVCSCCSDLGCGALTVKVEHIESLFIWSDFRIESNCEEGGWQSDFMKRNGPFEFDEDNYLSAIRPYTKKS